MDQVLEAALERPLPALPEGSKPAPRPAAGDEPPAQPYAH